MSGIKLRPIVFKVDPPLPYTLLYEQAVANYTASGWDTAPTIWSAHTYTTDKNFICFKLNLKVNSTSTSTGGEYSRGIRFYTSDNDGRLIGCGKQCVQGNAPAPNTLVFWQYDAGTAQAGSASDTFLGDWDETTYRANPNIATTDAATFKIVFDKTQNKAFCYIEDKQVMVVSYGSLDPMSWPLQTTNPGGVQAQGDPINVDCGIQVYACDTLEAAEQC